LLWVVVGLDICVGCLLAGHGAFEDSMTISAGAVMGLEEDEFSLSA